MGIDYAEKEREFLQSLAADTGRDLTGWMEAIAGSGLEDRNEIIDWLRTQGFLFAKASWMERIYHNGGRPIYADPADIGKGPAPALDRKDDEGRPALQRPEPAAGPAPPQAASSPPSMSSRHDPPRSEPGRTAATAETAKPAATPASLDALLADAKAYRPLAQLVLREIERAVSGVRFDARTGYVSLSCGEEFGILTIAPRELRLALAFGAQPASAPFVKARFPKSHPGMPSRMTHMVVLTDARQVTPELIAMVRAVAS